MTISDQALPWVLMLGTLAGAGLGILIAEVDRRLWDRPTCRRTVTDWTEVDT